EPGQNRGVGRAVDEVQELAEPVVLVGREGAVGAVLAGQPAGRVVFVGDDALFQAVGQLGQAADGVVVIVRCKTALVGGADMSAAHVVGVFQEAAAGVGNPGHAVGGVVLHGRGACRASRGNHVAVGVVVIIQVRAVGEVLAPQQAIAVVGCDK